MSYSIQLMQRNVQDDHTSFDVSKGKLDLIVLRYMARRLHLTLLQLNQLTFMSQPFLCTLQERHGRIHRIAIYNYQELFLVRTFMFIGFISRKQKNLCPSIIDDIQMVDTKLIKELASNSGILSYSSLELRNRDWCNLVVVSDADAKTEIKNATTHKYAAYQLANRYYEWIRLHNGIMPEGLDHTEMLLLKTKYYTFQAAQQKPAIRERVYELA